MHSSAYCRESFHSEKIFPPKPRVSFWRRFTQSSCSRGEIRCPAARLPRRHCPKRLSRREYPGAGTIMHVHESSESREPRRSRHSAPPLRDQTPAAAGDRDGVLIVVTAAVQSSPLRVSSFSRSPSFVLQESGHCVQQNRTSATGFSNRVSSVAGTSPRIRATSRLALAIHCRSCPPPLLAIKWPAAAGDRGGGGRDGLRTGQGQLESADRERRGVHNTTGHPSWLQCGQDAVEKSRLASSRAGFVSRTTI